MAAALLSGRAAPRARPFSAGTSAAASALAPAWPCPALSSSAPAAPLAPSAAAGALRGVAPASLAASSWWRGAGPLVAASAAASAAGSRSLRRRRLLASAGLRPPLPGAGARARSFASAAAAASAPAARKLSDPSALLDSVDIFIFDCDGVIWRGDTVIPGIPGVLDRLRDAGKTLFFVTNNSTKSRAGYRAKFDALGLNVKPEEIFSSSFAAAAYLEQTKFKATGKKVYVIGERGISEELDLIGVPWFGGEQDKGTLAPLQPGGKVEHDPDVGAVVVGFDRHISYYKIQYAQLCLNQNPGCQFIATNLDRVTHLTDAQEWAGNAAMVGAIRGCTGIEPTVVGKPAPLMIDYIEAKYSISDRSRICMVGDRLDTDIAFGRNNGLKTCLTLSGVTSENQLLRRAPRKAWTEEIEPEFFVDSINDFVA